MIECIKNKVKTKAGILSVYKHDYYQIVILQDEFTQTNNISITQKNPLFPEIVYEEKKCRINFNMKFITWDDLMAQDIIRKTFESAKEIEEFLNSIDQS